MPKFLGIDLELIRLKSKFNEPILFNELIFGNQMSAQASLREEKGPRPRRNQPRGRMEGAEGVPDMVGLRPEEGRREENQIKTFVDK